jgi:hypothetical protein
MKYCYFKREVLSTLTFYNRKNTKVQGFIMHNVVVGCP